MLATPMSTVGVGYSMLNGRILPDYAETEYMFDLKDISAVHKEFREFFNSGQCYSNLISEIRFIAADDNYLSPFYKRPSVAISFLMFNPDHSFLECVKKLEDSVFKKYNGRSHFSMKKKKKSFFILTHKFLLKIGKINHLTAYDMNRLYPMLGKFKKIRQQVDPNGLFLNPYLENLFGINSE